MWHVVWGSFILVPLTLLFSCPLLCPRTSREDQTWMGTRFQVESGSGSYWPRMERSCFEAECGPQALQEGAVGAEAKAGWDPGATG